MHDFAYKRRRLYCEDVDMSLVAERFGTPCYVYSHSTLIGHFRKLRAAFKGFDPLICYSLKANSNQAILRSLLKEGAGFDIVSGGELFRALESKIDPEKIVYASVGKTGDEIAQAIDAGIYAFNIESESELCQINNIAKIKNRIARIAIRINPDIEPGTHEYITTGKLSNKFGLSINQARDLFNRQGDFKYLDVCGLHMHIGSQIISSRPFIAALKKLIDFYEILKKEGHVMEFVNIGGGLGIIYDKEKPQTAREFAKNISPLIEKIDARIILEPGRFIVGNAGALLTKVIYTKKSYHKEFVITDAAMNDLIRPSLYQAYHKIVPVIKTSRKISIVDVVGPICESGDFFAKRRPLQEVYESDLLALLGAGAYGFSMASNYNSRPRACEVMVKGKDMYLIRERETYKDLISKERVPGFLL